MEAVAILDCRSCGEDYVPTVQGPQECEACMAQRLIEASWSDCDNCGTRFDPWDIDAKGPFCGMGCALDREEQLRSRHIDRLITEWKENRAVRR